MLTVAVLAFVLRFYLRYQNRKFDKAEEERRDNGDEIEEEGLVGPGRRKTTTVAFRYML